MVKWKRVERLEGWGAVTNTLESPLKMAAAIAMPVAADLPLPLPAVRDTVLLNCLVLTASKNTIMALA